MKVWNRQARYILTEFDIYSISMSHVALLGDRHALWRVNLVGDKVMLPKNRFLLWLAVHEKLLTKKSLQRLGLRYEDYYYLCFM